MKEIELPEPLILFNANQVIYADQNTLKMYWIDQKKSEIIKEFENTILDIQRGIYGLLVADAHGNLFLTNHYTHTKGK